MGKVCVHLGDSVKNQIGVLMVLAVKYFNFVLQTLKLLQSVFFLPKDFKCIVASFPVKIILFIISPFV